MYKSAKEKELSDAAYEIDEKIQFYKQVNKDKSKELQIRESRLQKVEANLKAREQYEIDEEERRKKEEEEEKFDLAALLAKAKYIKGKGIGYTVKRHYSTVNRIDAAKKQLQHRNSFTSMTSSKKPILNVSEQ